jgi:hypothetical protein
MSDIGDASHIGAPPAAGYDRRRMLLTAAAVGAVGIGASRIPLQDDRGRAEYEAVVGATWRHSASTDLPA